MAHEEAVRAEYINIRFSRQGEGEERLVRFRVQVDNGILSFTSIL